MSAGLVIRGASLLALDGRAGLRRTDLLVQRGRIAAIGGVEQRDAEVQEVRGVILPGLVQAHLHLDLSLQDHGFVPHQDPRVHHRVQRPAWREALDETGARTCAQAGLAWALATGSTTVADPSSVRHALATLSAATAVGGRVVLFVDGTRNDPREALIVLREAIEAQDLAGRVAVGLWGGEAERTSGRALRGAARAAETQEVPLVVQLGLMPGDRGGIERLERAGALHRHLVLAHAHGESLGGSKSLQKLARAGASVIITPSYEVLTGAPAAPVGRLLEAGISVGLGSDLGAGGLGMDLFSEVRLVLRQLEGRVATPASIALEMASRHGATALGLSTGSLEVGRAADLLLIGIEPDPSDDHEALARRIIDSAGPEHIHQIWVGGVPRLAEQGVRRAPADELMTEVRQRCQDHVRAQMGSWRVRAYGLSEPARRHLRRWRGWHTGRWP